MAAAFAWSLVRSTDERRHPTRLDELRQGCCVAIPQDLCSGVQRTRRVARERIRRGDQRRAACGESDCSRSQRRTHKAEANGATFTLWNTLWPKKRVAKGVTRTFAPAWLAWSSTVTESSMSRHGMTVTLATAGFVGKAIVRLPSPYAATAAASLDGDSRE